MASVNTNIHPVDAIQLIVGKPSDKNQFETLKIECRANGHAIRTTCFFYGVRREQLLKAADAFNRAIKGES